MPIIEKISGLYIIVNKLNSHFYLGSSCNIRVRFYNHKYKLNNNIHHSRYLQRAYNKYGKESFEFKVILVCEKDFLQEYEQKLLDSLKPSYNVSIDTTSPGRGKKFTEERKQRMSAMMMGHKNYLLNHSEETKKKIRAASIGRKKTLEDRLNISKRMVGNKHGIGNKGHSGLSLSDRTKELISSKLSKHYGKAISPGGEIYDITNLNKFCMENSLSGSSMHYLFSGKIKCHRGWKLCP